MPVESVNPANGECCLADEPIDGPGSFYRPGILAEIPKDSAAYGSLA